jgi:hypothetical protein
MNEADIRSDAVDVRFWPLADIQNTNCDDRF